MSFEKIKNLILSDNIPDVQIGAVLLNHSLSEDEGNGLNILINVLEQFKLIIEGENIYKKGEVVEKLEILLDEVKSRTAIRIIKTAVSDNSIVPATVAVYDQYNSLINKTNSID